MNSTAPVSDQVIEFFGELYVHEPPELRSRVQFRDYLDLLLRNMEPVRFHAPSHVHRCVCGTFVLCESPANSECGREPRCRDCSSTAIGPGTEISNEGRSLPDNFQSLEKGVVTERPLDS